MKKLGYEFNFDVAPGEGPNQVFDDPTKNRRRATRNYVLAAILIIMAWGYFFFSEALSNSNFTATLRAGLPGYSGQELTEGGQVQRQTRPNMQLVSQGGAISTPCEETYSPLFAAHAAAGSPRRLFAQLPSDMEWSHLSLNRECGAIDVLMPDWFLVASAEMDMDVNATDAEGQKEVLNFLSRRSDVALYPTVKLHPDVDRSDFFLNLADTVKRAKLVQGLGHVADLAGAQGICVDFGQFPEATTSVIGSFLAELSTSLALDNRQSCIIMSAGREVWASPYLADTADLFVIKLFVEPWSGSPPAPLAPQEWFRETAQALADHFGPERLVVALGTSSYDWQTGVAVPEKISFADAMTRVVENGAQVQFSKASANPYSSFIDAQGARHQIWALDAMTVHNQALILQEIGVPNVAVWELGHEDPSSWGFLSDTTETPAASAGWLARVAVEDSIHYEGTGPFIRITAPATIGTRIATQNAATGLIETAEYSVVPRAAAIERFGDGGARKVVLTFDDGPHPEYTRKILDALQASDVPAAFFLVGNRLRGNRDLVRRMQTEGHEIGSHSYSHAHLRARSETLVALELNMFQRAFSSLTGHSTLLFREPYQRSDGPLSLAQAEPMLRAQAAGYFYVGSDITPPDWTDISAEEITAKVLEELQEDGGNVIVLHDAGNDRSETVRAVPLIIAELRARGYEFVSLASLLALEPSALMPKAEMPFTAFFNVTFNVIDSFSNSLKLVFFVAIALGALRSLTMLVLAFRRKPHKATLGRYDFPVTVVIPAYNEEQSIIDTVESVLALKFANLDVMVIDDGSADTTFDQLLSRYSNNGRVRIVSQFNQGKWTALNYAANTSETDILICIDADTRIDENAVLKLVSHFRDPQVGAVAGKVSVRNRKGLLARLQALEYMTGQSIDRRAFEHLNAIMVVPGAIGAWRVSAVKASGGFAGDTLTEDADLTVMMNRLGYRICYEEDAVAETIVPTKIKQLLAQRLRWTLGTLQVGWKHKGALREGRALGRFAIPDLFLFGGLLPFLAPVADFMFLSFLIDWGMSAWTGDVVANDIPRWMIFTYLALPLLDVATLMAAQAFEPKERWTIFLLLPFQRFFYRQLLYYTAIRAVIRAITGHLAKWTKSHRAKAATQPVGDEYAP